MITYRAPAKMMISGEHAVVYGKPSLLSAIQCYATVSIEEHDQIEVPHPGCTSIDQTVCSYLEKHSIAHTTRPYRVTAQIEIPMGQGLGSSAALSVALSAGLFEWYTGEPASPDQINTLAYAAEKEFHGNPSGADNSACCFGGLIFFRKEFEFLKTISRLHAKLPKIIEQDLFLIHSGAPEESTKQMVQQVSRWYNHDPKEADRTLAAIEKETKRLVVSIIKEDRNFFAKSITENQQLLEQIGVVSSSTKTLLSSLQNYGTGKVTGAGGLTAGSGYLLFLADDAKKLEKYLTDNSISFLRVRQDYEGVTRVEDDHR